MEISFSPVSGELPETITVNGVVYHREEDDKAIALLQRIKRVGLATEFSRRQAAWAIAVTEGWGELPPLPKISEY